MFDWKSAKEWRRVFRYYQAGLINMAFGFGLYALFVRLGINIYVAQILSHFMGVAFNYLTYSRYVFHDNTGKRNLFIASYVVNYLLNLSTLALTTTVISSPYISGLISTVFVSFINYFVLKNLVFREHEA